MENSESKLSSLVGLSKETEEMRLQYEAEISRLQELISSISKSEERLQVAYMTSPDVISFTRLSDGLLVSVNEGFNNIFGYTAEECYGKSTLDMKMWVDPSEREILLSELRSKGSVRNFESRFNTKSGRVFTGLITASMIQIEGIDHIVTIIKDITGRKEAEEALRKEQFLMNSLMNNISDHVYFKDLDSKFIRTNKAQALSFGLDDPAKVIGKSDFNFFTEDAARQAFEDEQRIIRTGEPVLKEEMLTRKEGSDVWFSAIKMPLRDNDGNIIGTFGISRDITLRKRKELETQTLYEITRGITVTDNLNELLTLIHKSLSAVVYAKNFFIALIDEVTGLFSFPYFVDQFDQTPSRSSMARSCSAYVFRTVKPLLLSQERFDELERMGEVELVGSNSPSWVGIPLQTPSKVIGVLVLQHYEKENVYSEDDLNFLVSIGTQIAMVIERKKHEEEINLKNEQLQIINAEKDKFFSIIAHDLRGPLSAFVGATQIITEEIESMDRDEIKNITLSMKTSAVNIFSLLENLLEWSKLKRGNVFSVRENVNLKDAINSSIVLFTEQAARKRINLSVLIPGDIRVNVDRNMLDTIIRNLLSNAVKFTHPGGRIEVLARLKDENKVEIKVEDTGIGMDEQLKHRLFMLNEKTSRLGTYGELSSGLGLLLCKELVEKCGGEMFVESEEGKGSTFIFTLLNS
jgi:PAS domain S-box-containing protein